MMTPNDIIRLAHGLNSYALGARLTRDQIDRLQIRLTEFEADELRHVGNPTAPRLEPGGIGQVCGINFEVVRE